MVHRKIMENQEMAMFNSHVKLAEGMSISEVMVPKGIPKSSWSSDLDEPGGPPLMEDELVRNNS